MKFSYCLWPLGLAFVSCLSFAQCGSEPEGFKAWPQDEAVPVEAIPHENWFRSAQGWVVAPDRCQAVDAAWEREAAFEAFEQHFARTPLDGAIVDVTHAAAISSVGEAGAGWVLPWRFATDSNSEKAADTRAQTIREQIESQLTSAGRTPDPELVESLLQNALSQMDPAPESATNTLEPTALRHEVAHMLFIRGVWPSTKPTGTQYGGDAPDWLDEAAAIAVESDEMTAGRRAAFRQAARDGRLIPLERYLSMPHPVFGNSELLELLHEARETANREGAAVLSAAVGTEQIAEGSLFYAQTRGWLDFLLEKTENPQILGVVTDALMERQTFEQWLAFTGSDGGLPASMEALEAAFLSWASLPEN